MNLLRMLRRTAALERLQLPQGVTFQHLIKREIYRRSLCRSIKVILTNIIYLLTLIQLGLENILLRWHSQRTIMLLRSLIMEWDMKHFRSSLTRLKYHQEVINMRNKELQEKKLYQAYGPCRIFLKLNSKNICRALLMENIRQSILLIQMRSK